MAMIAPPRLVDTPTIQPGTCRLCGCITGRHIDTTHTDGYGRVYICADRCMPLFAALLGYATPLERDALVAERDAARARVAELEAQPRQVSLDAEATIGWIEQHRPGPKPKKAAA